MTILLQGSLYDPFRCNTLINTEGLQGFGNFHDCVYVTGRQDVVIQLPTHYVQNYKTYCVSCLLTVFVTDNFLFLFPCCRDVVFTSTRMHCVPLTHPSLGNHCLPQSTNQRGAEVRLATCYHCYANQQVTIQEEQFLFPNKRDHFSVVYK